MKILFHSAISIHILANFGDFFICPCWACQKEVYTTSYEDNLATIVGFKIRNVLKYELGVCCGVIQNHSGFNLDK